MSNCTTRGIRYPIALAVALSALAALDVRAATFTIADGDVAALIAAMQTANVNGDASNIINLAPKGMYVLTTVADSSPDSQASGAAGLPYVRNTLTINGNGAIIQRSTASGTPDFVILEVSSNLPDGQQECEGPGPGPRCNLNASLTLNQVTISGGSLGGVHMTYAPALIQNSTITQNTGTGGIINACGNLTLLNSTISSNSSNSGYGGGGIFLWQFLCWTGYPNANISFTTIFDNSNPSGGPGNAIGTNNGSPASVILKNTILASPSNPSQAVCNNGAGIISSLGHNVLGDASSCASALTAPGDLIGTDPLLGPTVDNGGPTPTDFPLMSSPAIGAVPVGDCTDVFGNPVTVDQRGFSRQCPTTIGSVEFEGLYHLCLLYDATKAVHSGATYPIKLQLCDGAGNDLSSANITVHGVSITQSSTSISGEIQDSGNANPDTDFRFDSTLGTTGGYILNLKTSGLTTGTYSLNFTVTGDTFVYAVPFQVK